MCFSIEPSEMYDEVYIGFLIGICLQISFLWGKSAQLKQHDLSHKNWKTDHREYQSVYYCVSIENPDIMTVMKFI